MPIKKQVKALERVFAAEIKLCLPYQTLNEETLLELEKQGLVKRIGEGWTLTHWGRNIYCESDPVPEELKL